jgi:succinate dehydrogenase flavin-adding protein (antitoxin of CptAB toxin-antitoxin module)
MPLQGQDLERLRWRCIRRGLLELDIILGRFLAEQYPTLDDSQAQAFGELAMMEDPDLWDLVSGRKASKNPAHAEVLQLLSKC